MFEKTWLRGWALRGGDEHYIVMVEGGGVNDESPIEAAYLSRQEP